MNIDGDGLEFVNAGEVSHTGDARNGVVYADVTADVYAITNTVSGSVDAGEGNNGDAISLQLGDEVHADVSNHGDVLGRGEAALSGLASGIRLFSGVTFSEFRGVIENSGVVSSEATSGVSAGVLVEDGVSFIGEINNSGEIFGPFNGIYVGDADHDMAITNTGTVASDSRAVNIGGDGVTLLNQGRILGTGDSRNGVVYADDEAKVFSIANDASGEIDAGAGNDGHAISVELGTFSEGDILNEGLLFGRGDSAGIRLFSNPAAASPDGSVFAGRIESSGRIETEGGPGILIEENVAVVAGGAAPAIVVTGDIEAPVALDAQAMSAGLTFAQAEGHIAGDLVFGSGDDDVTLADPDIHGGGSIEGLIHLGDGDDTLDAQNSTDDLHVRGGTGDDTILTGSGDDKIFAGSDNDDVFSGAGNDLVFGDDDDDAIDGGTGFDVIFGGAGADEIFAGAGFDVIVGGPGSDRFFIGPTSDVDLIVDFQIGADLIDLSLFGLFTSGAEAYAAGAQIGADAVWDFGAGDRLVLAETDYGSLSGDDFIV